MESGDLPIPDLEPGALLVRNEMAGICGSDLHLWRGTTFRPMQFPFLLGHETVGRIVRLAEGRTHDCAGESLRVGDRVLWENIACGGCYWCRIDHEPTLCARRIWQGVNTPDAYPHLSGGFGEYSYISPKSAVVRVPDDLTNEEVVGVGCAFMTVVHAWERLGGLQPQDNVVILGSGPLGLYATLLAREGGAATIIVVGAPARRLALAREWGADYTIDIEQTPDPADRLTEIVGRTRGIGPDVVVGVAGVPQVFADGLEMVRPGGRYLEVGNTVQTTVAVAPALLVYKQLTVIGSCHADISHIYRALEFVRTHRHAYPFASLVSGRYSLSQATEALLAMEAEREIKAVLVP
ncbi:MAG: zinc-binding dehydrogenase [Dehalococcoidia bacterium]